MEGARPATADDLPRVTELIRQGAEDHRPARGGSTWIRREARPEPIEPSLATAFESDSEQIWVGHIEGTIMGCLVARTERLHDGESLGVITEIVVEPGARAIGIGEAMMDLAVAWCTERECVGIDSLALPGDRNTKNFFESFGFKARAIIVNRSLEN